MPVEFVHDVSDANDAYKLVMAYDGSGRRVSKTRMRKADGGEWKPELVTHYTGIGVEDAADPFNGIDKDKLADYIPSTKFEWYLKNHLGSTMLVYGTSAYDDTQFSGYKEGGVRAAYDYRAFGEQVDLEQKGDKVTENFTGKERDDETELNYFGARYLDPMLGLWTSVDPKRQFSSPYLYAGNGMNPISSVDNRGNYMVRQRAGSYEIRPMSKSEAIVGTVARDVSTLGVAAGALAATVVGATEVEIALGAASLAAGPLKGWAQQSSGEKIIGSVESGTSFLMNLTSSFAAGITSLLYSTFDLVRSSNDIMKTVDSDECIDAFNSTLISNGGTQYNSFPTEQAAKEYMNSIPQCKVDDLE